MAHVFAQQPDMQCPPLPQHTPDLPGLGAVAGFEQVQVDGGEVAVEERLVFRPLQISAVLGDDLEVGLETGAHVGISAEAIVSLVYVDNGARYGGTDKVSAGQFYEQVPVLGSR